MVFLQGLDGFFCTLVHMALPSPCRPPSHLAHLGEHPTPWDPCGNDHASRTGSWTLDSWVTKEGTWEVVRSLVTEVRR